jgi:hypothetical protein
VFSLVFDERGLGNWSKLTTRAWVVLVVPRVVCVGGVKMNPSRYTSEYFLRGVVFVDGVEMPQYLSKRATISGFDGSQLREGSPTLDLEPLGFLRPEPIPWLLPDDALTWLSPCDSSILLIRDKGTGWAGENWTGNLVQPRLPGVQ